MLTDVLFFVLAATVSIGFVMLVYQLVNGILRSLLDDLLRMPAATSFYSRLLLVSMILIGLSSISGADFGSLGEDPKTMEYVWKLFYFLEDILPFVLLILGLFLVAMTILIAALKPRSE